MRQFYNKGDGTSQGEVEDPLTRPAPADENAGAVHPLPKGERGLLSFGGKGLSCLSAGEGCLVFQEGGLLFLKRKGTLERTTYNRPLRTDY